MITEIGGELGKIAEEEKRQTQDDIKVLEVKCWLNMMDIMLVNVNDPFDIMFKQHSFYLRITYSSVLFLKMMMMKTVLFWS